MRRLTGIKLNGEEKRAAFGLSRIAVSVQYVLFAIGHLGAARAEAMASEALRRARELARE